MLHQDQQGLLLPIAEELHFEILKFLLTEELLQLALVNSEFRRLINENTLWKHRYRSDFPEASHYLQSHSLQNDNYFQLYKATTLFANTRTSLNRVIKRKRDDFHYEAVERILRTHTFDKKRRVDIQESPPNGDETRSQQEKFDFELLYKLILTNNSGTVKNFIGQLKKQNDDGYDDGYINQLILLPYLYSGNQRHFSLLHLAAQNGNGEIIKTLLAECRPNTLRILFRQNQCHSSPFHIALESAQYKAADFFLADTNREELLSEHFETSGKNNPLHRAIFLDNPDMIEYLIQRNLLSVEHTLMHLPKRFKEGIKLDPETLTPLLYAAHRGHVNSFNTLLGLGADINARDSLGNNTLHHAIWGKNASLVQRLERMEEKNVANEVGFTPIQLATALGYTYTKLFNNPQLTTIDYRNILLNDWSTSRNRPSRLKDVIALLKDNKTLNLFADAEGKRLLDHLLTDVTADSLVRQKNRKDYSQIQNLLTHIKYTSQLTAYPTQSGSGLFSSAPTQPNQMMSSFNLPRPN